ncbi:imidazole glycerol phosphate synthase subunit HisF [soil metagenome]
MSSSGLCKRIIPCLDVANGRTVKGVKFQNLRDIGDPVELAIEYQRQGADELMFLDISASREERSTVFDLVRSVAEHLSIPFTVGGGISKLDDVKKLLSLGADKVSINSSAVQRPELIAEIAAACGSQCCVVAIDARKVVGSQTLDSQQPLWDVLTKGGSVSTGLSARAWAQKCVELGAGEFMLTSWDADGTQEGFDIEMVAAFSHLPIPIIASGGAKNPQSFVDVFSAGQADAALAASIFHDGLFTVNQVKTTLKNEGITVRLC